MVIQRHTRLDFPFALALLACLTAGASAQKWNLTQLVPSPLVAARNHPGSEPCTVPGVCYPVNQTIPKQSAWYWCGFYSTHRTIYTVSSLSTNNITQVSFMRRSVFDSCATQNVTLIDKCAAVPESTCSGGRKCSMRMFGLVFPDEMCMIVINSKGSDILASVQAWNFHDSPRYYGTVFTLFFTIVGGGAILANVAWQFYAIIVAPVNKHHQHRPAQAKPALTPQDSRAYPDAEPTKTESSPPAKSQPSMYQKLLGILRPASSDKHSA